MKTLYIECYMGAAGDMLMAALADLLPDPESFIEKMNRFGIPGVLVKRSPCVRCGIMGNRITVLVNGKEEGHDVPDNHFHNDDHDHGTENQTCLHPCDHNEGHHHHEHGHAGIVDIAQIIDDLPVSAQVKTHAKAVYALIAEAESHAHGRPVDKIHFHEIGAMDAVADIVGVSLLMEELAPQVVIVSPIHVGSGQVLCSHGILPVPAPATAYILQGVPTYGGAVSGELCTPTGAALLKHFANRFAPMPAMVTEAIGYGMGSRDFEAVNCVRAFLGESIMSGETVSEGHNEVIAELSCQLDDMTGEAIGFAAEVLFASGALDVFTIPIQMKKSRPGQLLVCQCRTADVESMVKLILQHTTTFGVRKTACQRYILDRNFSEIDTPYGPIHVKTGSGYGVNKYKLEHADLAEVARSQHLSLDQVRQSVADKLDTEIFFDIKAPR